MNNKTNLSYWQKVLDSQMINPPILFISDESAPFPTKEKLIKIIIEMKEEELRKNPNYQKVMDGMYTKIVAERLENKFTNPIGKISLKPRKKTKNHLQYINMLEELTQKLKKLKWPVKIRLVIGEPQKSRVIVDGIHYEIQNRVKVNGESHYPLKKVRPKKLTTPVEFN